MTPAQPALPAPRPSAAPAEVPLVTAWVYGAVFVGWGARPHPLYREQDPKLIGKVPIETTARLASSVAAP